jgi:hypothetical protein
MTHTEPLLLSLVLFGSKLSDHKVVCTISAIFPLLCVLVLSVT